MLQVSDEGAIAVVVDEVLADPASGGIDRGYGLARTKLSATSSGKS